MTINVDEAKLVAKVNEVIDIPYASETTEAKLFASGVEAAVGAIVQLAGNIDALADYGVTVTNGPATPI